MRTILDIDRSTSGLITFDGQRFSKLDSPSRVVGSMLDANAVELTANERDYRSTGETRPDTSIASRVGTLVRRPVRKRAASSVTGPALQPAFLRTTIHP